MSKRTARYLTAIDLAAILGSTERNARYAMRAQPYRQTLRLHRWPRGLTLALRNEMPVDALDPRANRAALAQQLREAETRRYHTRAAVAAWRRRNGESFADLATRRPSWPAR